MSCTKYYAIKKFSPSVGNDEEECFKRFIDEIKILINLNHKNIVRFYTYYLYPSNKLGYILMEYIEGETVDNFLENNMDKYDQLFKTAIETFKYLEDNNVLHRDIRPQNFMVTNDELKVIDFGFSKTVNIDNNETNSVLLNWPVTQAPEELKNGQYDRKTEIYYLGWLFKKLKNNYNSQYDAIIDKMCEYSPSKRYSTFQDVYDGINSLFFASSSFSVNDKIIYRRFADALFSTLDVFITTPTYYNSDEVLEKLKDVLTDNSLENDVQRNNILIKAFVRAKFKYYTKNLVSVSIVRDFYDLLTKSSKSKREVIINNIINRFKNVIIKVEDDKLPF